MRIQFIAAAAAAALVAGAASAADFVILDSSAAGIEAGLVVDGAADVTIPAGAQVVMIDPAGTTLVVEGPFAGRLSDAASASDGSLGDAIDRITGPQGEDTTVLGAVRGPKIEGGSVTE